MLNARLRMVVSLIDPCDSLCDIGSDHGYLPIEALKSKIIKNAQIVELRSKPLSMAYEHVKKEQLLEVCSFFLSDGLSKVNEEVSNVVICGMGYDTILHIIKQNLERFKSLDQLILQSNSKIPNLRKQMYELGFELMDERFIVDRKQPYVALKYHFHINQKNLTEQELYLGPFLMREASKNYVDYCMNQLNQLKSFPELYLKSNEIQYLNEFLHSKEKV